MKNKRRQARRDPATSTKQRTIRAGKRPGRSVRSARAAELLQADHVVAGSLARVPAKWRWHHRVLLSLQSRLLRERGALLQAAAEPIEPHSVDEADSATDEFDHDLALTQLSAGQDALYEVNQAISRIHNGTYGLCEETGEVVPAARLRAVPWTRYSLEVENRLEKKGVTSRARVRKAATVRGSGRVWFAPEEEAEETEEKPPAPPKDEALTKVFSPPGRHVSRREIARHSPNAARRKGRSK